MDFFYHFNINFLLLSLCRDLRSTQRQSYELFIVRSTVTFLMNLFVIITNFKVTKLFDNFFLQTCCIVRS